MATVRTLDVSLRARTEKFQKGMRDAGTRLNRFRKTALKTAGVLAGAGAGALTGAAVIATGALSALTKQSFSTLDVLGKTADKLGIASDQLAGLRHAAELSGVSVQTFDMAFQRFTRRLAEAGKDAGEAKAALAELGVPVKAFLALRPEERFRRLADSFANVKNKADQVRIAMKLFDSEGVSLVNTLALGREGLDAAQKSVEAFGAATERHLIARVEKANDAWAAMQLAVRGLADEIAITLAPKVQEVSFALGVMFDAARRAFKGTVGTGGASEPGRPDPDRVNDFLGGVIAQQQRDFNEKVTGALRGAFASLARAAQPGGTFGALRAKRFDIENRLGRLGQAEQIAGQARDLRTRREDLRRRIPFLEARLGEGQASLRGLGTSVGVLQRSGPAKEIVAAIDKLKVEIRELTGRIEKTMRDGAALAQSAVMS